MNVLRLAVAFLLVAWPAVALPLVRRTRRPRTWAILLACSLAGGFVLVEAALVHASLPLLFDGLGLDHLADACRDLGGHLFAGAPLFSGFAGGLALLIGVNAVRGVADSMRFASELRTSAAGGVVGAIGEQKAIFLPLPRPWAVALPGGRPQVLLSTGLVQSLETREVDAIVRHEIAHLEHHHVRFLLLGGAVSRGMAFLPWSKRSFLSLRLALERWADESAAGNSSEDRAHVRSALRKLAAMAPSRLAADRLTALDDTSEGAVSSRDLGWTTAVSALAPLVLGLTLTLVIHLVQVITVSGWG